MGTVEMVGQFTLSLAICAPVVLLANMQLASIQATDAHGVFAFRDYVFTRLAMLAAAAATLLILSFLIPLAPATRAVLTVVILFKLSESLHDVAYGHWQKHEVMNYMGRSLLVRALAGTTAFAIIMITSGNLVMSTAGLLVVNLILFAGHDLPLALVYEASDKESEEILPEVMKLVKLAAPLGIVSMLDSLATNLPKYLLQWFKGEEAVGFYSAIVAFVVVGGTTMSALAAAMRPRLARHLVADAWRSFVRLILVGIGVGLCVAIVSALFMFWTGDIVLRVVYTEAYVEYARGLALVLLLAGLWYIASILATGLTAARRLWGQPLVYGASIMITILIGFVIVPSMGVIGGVISLGAGFAARAGGMALMFHRLLGATSRGALA